MSVTMVHANPAAIQDGRLRIDRKFHVGMLNYAKHMPLPITTVHPAIRPGQLIMDAIELPLSELPYAVMTFETDACYRLLPFEHARMQERIAGSRLVYGSGMGCESIARRLGVPYIMVLEYDLPTQITVTTCDINNALRRAVRTTRCISRYASGLLQVRRAHSIHCNGYPIYDALRRYNRHRLLYLDSRMSADMVMAPQELTARLNRRAPGRLRLLYSGRYERLKGADDAVRVAVECLRRGLDIELHCYGQGSLRARMQQIASQFPERIHIHDAVPYPELVRLSRAFDVFVCCHIQNDPSCTYLESFGAGLPIVGYGNRMWQRLCADSGAGLTSALGEPSTLAASVERLAQDDALLRALSERALRFASAHCFEAEFKKRVNGIGLALESTSPTVPSAPFATPVVETGRAVSSAN